MDTRLVAGRGGRRIQPAGRGRRRWNPAPAEVHPPLGVPHRGTRRQRGLLVGENRPRPWPGPLKGRRALAAAGMVSRSRIWARHGMTTRSATARRLERRRFRPGRRVDHRQIDTLLGGSLDRVLKTRRLDIRHYGSGLLSPVPPAAGARLRVRIQYDDRPPLARGLDRQRKSNARLADAAFSARVGLRLP